MNRQGRYQTLSRLARGAVFHLSNMPADTNSWKVLRHRADGLTEVERLHEDRTLKRQFPRSTLMVFVPVDETVLDESGHEICSRIGMDPEQEATK
jgi:hypothetical protein